jgi:hypothetical protein
VDDRYQRPGNEVNAVRPLGVALLLYSRLNLFSRITGQDKAGVELPHKGGCGALFLGEGEGRSDHNIDPPAEQLLLVGEDVITSKVARTGAGGV